MIRPSTALLTPVLALAASQPGHLPPILGLGTSPLPPDDLAAVRQSLRTADLPVWFLETTSLYEPGSQSPPRIGLKAYLKPTVKTPRLRRGEVRFLWRRSDSNQPRIISWPVSPEIEAYAQVAPSDIPFSADLSEPNTTELPFCVIGSFSDSQLLSLVDAVRNVGLAGILEATSGTYPPCLSDSTPRPSIISVDASRIPIEVLMSNSCAYDFSIVGRSYRLTGVGTVVE